MRFIDPSKIAEQINRDLDLSIPEQVCDVIEMWSLSGTVTAGDLLPSVRLLSEVMGISHKTARRCQELLKERGLIKITGHRTYCVGIPSRERAKRMARFEQTATNSIIALRESGCSLDKARAMVETAWEMERGPYVAV